MATFVRITGKPILMVGSINPYATNKAQPTMFTNLNLNISFITKDTATAMLAA